MHDSEAVKRLHRGEHIHLDCSGARLVSAVCYQETNPSRTSRCVNQSKQLEISSQLPLCKSASAHFTCATNSTKAATYAANAQACNSKVNGSVAIHNPGATTAKVEFTGRTYALLFRRFLHNKVWLCANHGRQKTSLTSTAEFAVPGLMQQLSCKANITTDLFRRVGLQAELQWKANPWDEAKHSKRHEKKRENTMPLCRAKASARDVNAQQHVSDRCQPHNLCLTETSRLTSTLPWSSVPLPIPAPMHAHKQRITFGKGATEERSGHLTEADHRGSASSQCTLQIKGSPEGQSKPSWHLKMQKSVRRKTQLRGQISALLAPMTFLPSKWQMEARHRLPKGATFYARLQGEDVQQSGRRKTSKHQLLLERKARDAWWTCTCASDSAGWQLGLRRSVISGKSRTSHQHYTVKFTANMHVASRRCDKFSLKADLITSI